MSWLLLKYFWFVRNYQISYSLGLFGIFLVFFVELGKLLFKLLILKKYKYNKVFKWPDVEQKILYKSHFRIKNNYRRY